MKDRLVRALQGLQLQILTIPGLDEDSPEYKSLAAKFDQSLELANRLEMIAALEVLE